MVKLAVNGIPALYELLYSNDLPLDYIKCPLSPNSKAEVERARHFLPVILHGWGPPGYSVTMREVPEPHLLKGLSQSSHTPFISAHIDYLPERDGNLNQEQLTQRIGQSVEQLKQLTGQRILLENLPWYAWKTRPRFSTDGAFFSHVLTQTNSYMLLDLSHAQVAAFHRGEDALCYILQMPLDRVLEIHMSGPRMSEQGLRDFHRSLREEDYVLLQRVMQHTPNLEVLTLEYMQMFQDQEPDGPSVLMEQIQRLDRIRKNFTRPKAPAVALNVPVQQPPHPE